MQKRQWEEWLYLANGTVLLTHQIDAAFWHEWTLFNLPGGIQFFLVLNLPMVFLVLYGMRALGKGEPAGIRIAWILAAGGAFACLFHGYHSWNGSGTFSNPMSIGLLGATLLLSLAQALSLLRRRTSGRH